MRRLRKYIYLALVDVNMSCEGKRASSWLLIHVQEEMRKKKKKKKKRYRLTMWVGYTSSKAKHPRIFAVQM